MKRLLSALFAALLLFSLAAPASASQILPQLDKLLPGSGSVYTDPDTNNTLTVPDGWSISEVTGDPVAKIELLTAKKSVPSIQYGSVDMLSQLSEDDKGKVPRDSLNNEAYSPKDIAQLVETKEKYVDMYTFGEISYFRAEVRSLFQVSKTYFIRIDQGWMYVYVFDSGKKNDAYEDFLYFVASAAYGQLPADEEAEPTDGPSEEPTEESTAAPAPSDAEIYETAVDAYWDRSYEEAKCLFLDIADYEDSEKYLRLINIRNFGGNTGIGTVYDPCYALNDFQKSEIDEAMKDFSFADTSSVILCNTDVACYTLFGGWVTEPGSYPYAYFRMKPSASGGFYYTRSSNLSNAVSKTVSINNGEVRISITDSNTLVFRITMITPTSMLIYSYETCKEFYLVKE